MKIGVLGGGQLGRMLALAGGPLELSLRFLDPESHACAAAFGEHHRAAFEDASAIAAFARGLDVATLEFENVPAACVRELEKHVAVYPGAAALEVAQDRLAEKQLFTQMGLAVPKFAPVASLDELLAALDVIGLPAVLKTRRMGYDGKGQGVIRTMDDAAEIWKRVTSHAPIAAVTSGGGGASTPPVLCLVESMVAFERELSLVAVRGRDGAFEAYPLVQNHHRAGILRTTIAPAPGVSAELQHEAEKYARAIMGRLEYVGVLAIELFDMGGAKGAGPRLLGNEMAPRVHNSGHWTIEGAETSQFENHLRAVAGLPLGSCATRGHSVMVNIIGTAPPLRDLLAILNAHVHIYGKAPRPGRKIGHVTVVCESSTEAEVAAEEVVACLEKVAEWRSGEVAE